MPNKVLLNDRMGIPNRLWPVCSDLTGLQWEAWQLGLPKNGSSGELPLVQTFLLPCLAKRGLFHSLNPSSYTRCFTHATRWDNSCVCSTCIITVSRSWFTRSLKEFLLFNSSAGNTVRTSCEPTKSKPRICTDSCVVQLLQRDQSFLSWFKKQVMSHK